MRGSTDSVPQSPAARTGERGALGDLVAYRLVLGGVCVLQGSPWYYWFKEKLFDDKPILFGALAPAMVRFAFMLLLMPPDRPIRWLSSLAGRAEDE